ncbi:MAG: hypothetical protein ACTSP4_01785 [Candidatus Hodarchaeales archaeon]
MADFKIYQTMTDGGYVEVRYSGQKTFRKDEVFIIEHEASRRIFIWVGSQAPVRKKFISSQIASQLRMTLGLTYKITNEEEGMETSEFVKIINLAEKEVSPTHSLQEQTHQPSKAASPSLFDQIEEASKGIVKEERVLPNRSYQKTPIHADRRNTTRNTSSSRAIPTKTSTRPEPMKKTERNDIVQDKIATRSLEISGESQDSGISIMKDFILKTIESSAPNLDNYYEAGVEETYPVLKDKARRIIDNRSISSGKRVVLNRIFVSFKGNTNKDDSLAFYESKESSLEADCTYKVPVVKLFLNNNQSGANLLHIVLSRGTSLYYTCPGGIYFSLMFAEI